MINATATQDKPQTQEIIQVFTLVCYQPTKSRTEQKIIFATADRAFNSGSKLDSLLSYQIFSNSSGWKKQSFYQKLCFKYFSPPAIQ